MKSTKIQPSEIKQQKSLKMKLELSTIAINETKLAKSFSS